MDSPNNWIICFGSNWFTSSVYIEKHLIKKFSQDGYSVLWLNPIPIKNLSIKGPGSKAVFVQRIIHRLKIHSKLIKKIDKKFWIINPLFLPVFESYISIKINNILLKIQLSILKYFFNIKNEIVFSSTITDIHALFSKNQIKKFIQISGDLYSDSRDISKKAKSIILEREGNIFEFADIILACSRRIKEKISSRVNCHDKIIYFPHGVDYKNFCDFDNSILLNFQKPVCGYFGSLTDANDKAVFLKLAESGFSVVLIGKVLGDYSACQHFNIHYLGPIEYHMLPSYARYFDICIMAWKPAEWIENCNPIKTLEYLSLGKPVISNSIPELRDKFSELIYFADTPLEFVTCAKKALKENNIELENKRKRIAMKNDWDEKYKLVKSLIFN